jgi:hypothetical protein
MSSASPLVLKLADWRYALRILFALLLTVPLFLLAQSRFEGTWEMKMDTLRFSATPEEYLLEKGVYHCVTCAPRVDVEADGTDQKVAGHYFNSIAVRVVDAQSVEFIQKKDGKVTFTVTETVSRDGLTMTEEFVNTMDAETVSGKAQFTRVSQGPSRSHALSGKWQMQTVKNATRAGTLTTYKSISGGLKISDGNQSFDAKFDGKGYPAGADSHATTSLKLIDGYTIEETDKEDGKVVVVTLMQVSKDGKTMKVESFDKLRGATMAYTAEKQP